MKALRKGGLLIGLLIGLIAIYTIALLAAYVIPDELIEKNVLAAIAVIREEANMAGGYGTYFWHNGYGITDNLSDEIIYSGLLRNGSSVADSAMRTEYVRYWHGYAAILRPLMVVFSIINIRYLNMMVIFGLFMACCWQCAKKLSSWTAFAFGGGLLSSFILIAPFCQHYCAVYMISLAGCYGIFRFWKYLRKHMSEFFLILGSLVSFFDLLTFPVMALGYPLLVALLMYAKEGKTGGKLWLELFVLSSVWMASYAATWLSKALIGSVLTEVNVWADIIQQVVFRLSGDYADGQRTTAWLAICKNLETYFMGSNVAFWTVCVVVYGIRALRNKPVFSQCMKQLPIAAVAAYPFIWYCVLQNHVRMHFWMTYRIIAVSFFALMAYIETLGSYRATRE